MNIEKLKGVEDIVIAIMGSLLCVEHVNNQIKQFIDNSFDNTLKENEIIVETNLKKFKISVEEI